jgi:hypothetical protein
MQGATRTGVPTLRPCSCVKARLADLCKQQHLHAKQKVHSTAQQQSACTATVTVSRGDCSASTCTQHMVMHYCQTALSSNNDLQLPHACSHAADK